MATNPDQEIPSVVDHTGSTDERKLWLDYLKSLNERRLQAAQRSGLTNRVLLAVLAGLIYRFVPRLTGFFANAEATSATLVSIVLVADAAIYSLISYGTLLYYCAGGIEHRVIPEPKRRFTGVTLWGFLLLGVTFSLFQLWVGLRLDLTSRYVKWSVVILGIWWGSNLCLSATKQIKAARRARAQKIPTPRFTGSVFGPDRESLIASGFCLSVAIFSSITLVVYLKNLRIDWVGPLGAASALLTCFAICGLLFYRGLSLASEGTYDLLERDILLDQLDAKEIRSRFVRYTLGPDTTAWLDELLAGLKTEDDNLTKLLDSSKKHVEEINAIDPLYSAERRARAKSVVDELKGGIQRHKTNLESFKFQMGLFFEVHRTRREREVLERLVKDLETRAEESKKIVLISRELLGNLSKLIDK